MITLWGAGPAALFAALRLAAKDDVRIVADRIPRASDPPRIEASPVQLVHLLAEHGITPRRAGFAEPFTHRLAAWESAKPVASAGPRTTHVDRRRLDGALLEAALATGRVTIELRELDGAEPTSGVIDATGRRAIACPPAMRHRAPEPWSARTLSLPLRDAPRAAFAIGAFSFGYVWRLGVDGIVVLGFASPEKIFGAPADELAERARREGGSWMFDDLPNLSEAASDVVVPASVQWTEGPVLAIGDAAFARDPLSSQGLLAGLSDVIHALAAHDADASALFARRESERRSHLGHLSALCARAHAGAAKPFARYGAWLSSASAGSRETLPASTARRR